MTTCNTPTSTRTDLNTARHEGLVELLVGVLHSQFSNLLLLPVEQGRRGGGGQIAWSAEGEAGCGEPVLHALTVAPGHSIGKVARRPGGVHVQQPFGVNMCAYWIVSRIRAAWL